MARLPRRRPDHPRSTRRPSASGAAGHRGRDPRVPASATTADGLGRPARQLRSSPFMVAMAAYATLINRVSGTDDVLIGTPVGGRTESELDPLIEFFVNTVPVRVDLSGATTFGELVQRCRCCHCPCPWLGRNLLPCTGAQNLRNYRHQSTA